MREDLPSGTVTFLFTDIEGSTRLLHELGPDSYAEALAEHRRALRAAFTSHHGVEVDTQGDAFFVAFPTAPGAASAALDAQSALEPGRIRVRMGLHTGTPTLTGEGYVGIDVHRGARVGALAHGGQVLVTEATATLLDLPLTDLGRHRLKDFDGPARLLQLGTGSFPPLRTPGTVMLPTPATPFLGRDRELFDGVALVLEYDPAILTIVGPGGTGKTRYALELARLLAEDADGGTLFVPLAGVRDATLVAATVAEAIGAESGEPADVAARVGEKRTHVVLDNVEQLLPEAAPILASLVEECAALRLLVTSREALAVRAETRLDLPPLTSGEAVELFLSRSRAVRPEIGVSPAVTTLCDRLDRLPLALELAAARTRILTPEAMLERLSARLDLPSARDADPRQSTLRATIAWSFELLSEEERELFVLLSVFSGGCTLEAAEAVCDADVETLAALLDKSLVRRRQDPDGRDRYWMLETIREFAAGLLAERAELGANVRSRHAEHMLSVARAAQLSPDDVAKGLRPDYSTIRTERDDVRTAIDWAIDSSVPLAGEIVSALEQHWVTSAPVEGCQYVERLLDSRHDLPTPLRARLLRLHGSLVILNGDLEVGEARYTEALDHFRELRDDFSVVGLRMRFAVHAVNRGDTEEARAIVAEVRALNETVGNAIVQPQLLSTLGGLAQQEGDLPAALAHYRHSVEVAEGQGFLLWAVWVLESVLDVELQLGLLDEAEGTGRKGLGLAADLDDHRMIWWFLMELAVVELRRGELERAGSLWGALLAAREDERPTLNESFMAFSAPLRECAEERFRTAVENGMLLPLASAVELALAEPQTAP